MPPDPYLADMAADDVSAPPSPVLPSVFRKPPVHPAPLKGPPPTAKARSRVNVNFLSQMAQKFQRGAAPAAAPAPAPAPVAAPVTDDLPPDRYFKYLVVVAIFSAVLAMSFAYMVVNAPPGTDATFQGVSRDECSTWAEYIRGLGCMSYNGVPFSLAEAGGQS